MSTPVANPPTLGDGYDTTSDFPSDPAGWGEPGSIRHAEAIGHGVWMAEHIDGMAPSAELIARSQTGRAELARAEAASKASRLFEPEPEYCPIHDCIRLDHPTWEMCEGFDGHTWFQGEPHDTTDATKEKQ